MNTFETIIILDTNETIAKAEVKKFKDIIQDWNKTEKVKVDNLGVKELAYEIKTHKAGYYVIFTFRCHHAHIAELERLLRIDDHVLKFITVKKDDDTEEFEEYDEDEAESEQATVDTAPVKQPVDVLDIIYGLNKEVK